MATHSTPAAPSAAERLHGLDALRSIALLLGLVLHAAMSFLPSPAIQIWIVVDNQPTPVLAVAFFFIHLFRMAAFFLIAGYFAELLLERRGPWGFAKNRLIRIGGPLVTFWGPALGGIVACLVWAEWIRNGYSFPADAPPPPPLTLETLPLTHLWFLWMLLIFYAVLLLVRALFAAIDRSNAVARAVGKVMPLLVSPWGLPIVAAPLALAFYLKSDWFMWFGVPTADTGLIPNAVACVAYGIAFVIGIFIRRNSAILLSVVERWWLVWVMLAVSLGGLSMVLAGGLVPDLLTRPVQSVGNAATYALAMYAAAFAGLALCLRFLSGHSPLLRYLSDASYWVYIVHLPIVMALQVMVHDLSWPWPIKFAAIVIGAAAVSLASYELLIRHTFMGRWLNGRKIPWRRAPAAATTQPSAR